ncbi:MAG: hypothetical protein LC624_12075 [Halobacteriales archaeon]|nr:hypothetical protein [Halobacteriales archaeon]
MLRLAPFALAALLLLTALPAQGAFHGVGWSADGVATDGTHTYQINIAWGGFYSFTSPNVFVITLTDPLTGAVTRDDFIGTETLYGQSFGGSTVDGLLVLCSTFEPGVTFTCIGTQWAFPYSQTMSQHIAGSYGSLTWTAVTLNQHYCFC